MNKHLVYDSERIEKAEVVIADVQSLPVTNVSDPFISPNLTISLNHSGEAQTLYDMRPVEFKLHNMAVVLPDHIIGQGNTTEDYRVTLIIVAKSFYEELINRESFSDYLKYKTKPNFQLSEEQYNKVVTILNTLRLVCNSDHPKRHELLANLLDILFYALMRYRGEEKDEARSTHLFN